MNRREMVKGGALLAGWATARLLIDSSEEVRQDGVETALLGVRGTVIVKDEVVERFESIERLNVPIGVPVSFEMDVNENRFGPVAQEQLRAALSDLGRSA